MKTISTLFLGVLLSISSVFSGPAFSDAASVADWNYVLTGATWFKFNKPIKGSEFDVDASVVKKTAVATEKLGLDPMALDFDAEYASIPTNPNKFVSKALGLDSLCNERPMNDFDANDFIGEWKAAYDGSYVYIFVKYLDDVDMGTETVEVMWSQALKIDAPDTITTSGTPSGGVYLLTQIDSMALYHRFQQFGGYKAQFTVADGFKGALVLTGGPRTTNSYADGQKPALLVDNLSFYNKTDIANPLLKKHIVRIGYGAFTGAFRPDFDDDIWNTLNGGRGLSFEVKVGDPDGNEVQSNTTGTPKYEPAGYFWNNKMGYSLAADVWGSNAYAGFLKNDKPSGVNTPKANNSIFSKITPNQIQLSEMANVKVYNTVGKVVLANKNTNLINLTSLGKGVYVVRANNATVKVVR